MTFIQGKCHTRMITWGQFVSKGIMCMIWNKPLVLVVNCWFNMFIQVFLGNKHLPAMKDWSYLNGMDKISRPTRLQFQKVLPSSLVIPRSLCAATCRHSFPGSVPAFTSGSRLPGTVWEVLSILRLTVHTIHKCPAFRGQSRLSGFCRANRLCVRSPCHHNLRMRTFDENSCAISITSPRSLFRPRTQPVWWDHREKSRRASHTMGLPGLKVPANGTWCERRVQYTQMCNLNLVYFKENCWSNVIT